MLATPPRERHGGLQPEEDRMPDQIPDANEVPIEDLGLATELTANARGKAAEGNRGRT